MRLWTSIMQSVASQSFEFQGMRAEIIWLQMHINYTTPANEMDINTNLVVLGIASKQQQIALTKLWPNAN